MKNINNLLQELLIAYQSKKILLFSPMPKPTPTPIALTPQPQNGGGFKNWLRQSLSPKPPRSELQAGPPPPTPPPFNSEQFAINRGNEFTELLVSILKIGKGDVFHIPDDLGHEPTIPKIPPFTNSSPYNKSASEIKMASHKYEYRQMKPSVKGMELTLLDLNTLAYGIQLQNQYIQTLRKYLPTLPPNINNYIDALEALHFVLERISEDVSCDAISLWLDALKSIKPF